MKIGNRQFDLSRTHIMGIINVTPDSFSDGGRFSDTDDMLRAVEKMIEDGADIIDIGGQSTKPNYIEIPAAEEAERLLPALTAVKKRFDIPLSVDTYFSTVAKMAIEAGADMINDIWGLKTPDMAEVIARSGVACCLMHNRKEEMLSTEGVDSILAELAAITQFALNSGIKGDKIILDPGVGFAKTHSHNLQVLANLKCFKELNYPMLLGCSRKSVIGKTLNLPTNERLEGTLATTALAVLADFAFVRVHDIKENVRIVKQIEEIKKWIK